MHGVVADLNHRMDFDETPLHEAVRVGWLEAVTLLLKGHAEINAQDNEGRTPLHFACKGGDVRIVKILCHNGVEVNQPDDLQNTPLHLAADGLHSDCIFWLVKEARANTQVKNNQSQTPFDMMK